MASIDKTYAASYTEYKRLKDWASTQYVTFYDGYKVAVSNFIYEWEEEDFLRGDIPVMYSPPWLDIYLIQNCKIDFVIDRFKEVYSKEEFEEFLSTDLTAKPSKEFQQNRKIVVKLYDRSRFRLHNKPFKGARKWFLQCNNHNFWYNDKTKKWVDSHHYYPWNTNTTAVSSVKSLIRHLRKQYLPKGIIFRLSGRYIGEDYLVYVK